MTRSLCILLFSIFFPAGIAAQTTYDHNLFWGRLVLSDTVTSKLKWEIHLQKRTQNTSDDYNVFGAPQFSAIWFWLNIKISDNLTLGITPFSRFDSRVLYVKPSDLEIPGVKEYRWVARLDNEQKFRFLNYITRFSLEYRLRDIRNNNNYQGNYRTRFMFRFEKPLRLEGMKRPITLILYDEVMLQFGKAVRGNPNIFDQNRIYGGVNYPLYKTVRLNVGYIYGIQQRISGDEIDRINTLWVVLTFDNLFSQFKRNT